MAILVKSHTNKSEKNRWATTWEAFADAQALYGRPFSIDVCAEPETAKCDRFFTSVDWFDNNRANLLTGQAGFSLTDKTIVGFDALSQAWENDWWCNPPFDFKQDFIAYATAQAKQEGRSGMMFLPHEPLTGWWRKQIEGIATAVYLPDGRYPFYEVDGKTKKRGVNFGSAFVLFTPHAISHTMQVPFTRYLAQQLERNVA